MKNKFHLLLVGIVMLGMLVVYWGCNKEDITVNGPGSGSNVTTYYITVTVLGPSGAPQGGATVALQNPPYTSTIFSAITDSAGHATIQAPAGNQTVIVTMGTVFTTTINVNVQITSTPQTVGTVTLTQSTSTNSKVLVIYAGCENIENVLTNSGIAFTKFDTTNVYYMRSRVDSDSTATLNFLKQYAIVFSDCNCGDEYGYAKLARCYGRYVQQGGKLYGGHYNYYNLQYIFPPYFKTSVYGSNDTLKVLNSTLSTALGYNVIHMYLSGYEMFSDMPGSSTTTIYAVMAGSPTSPSSPSGVPIIVENRLGTGKYVWTTYHNQDILSDPRLIKIVRYFLYNM
jgi:hypothetical protein